MNFIAIYVMWLREMKRFLRAKSRIIGTLMMPLMFLAFLGFGLSKMSLPGMPKGIDYIDFLVPGILGMSMLSTSMFGGLSVLWDKEFGFLKEIMVAPVGRISIVLGRIAGGATTSMIQGIMVLCIAVVMGFKITSVWSVLLALAFMLLISVTFIGLGLIFASQMKDFHGFGLVMNFVILPLFFLSGAMYPINNLPPWIKYVSYVDPLTFGVDGLRNALIGTSSFPIMLSFTVIFAYALVMVFLGAYLFEKSESA